MAVETFGGLDILVNNAGILRDRLFANMSEEDWDAVIRVHLKGHAAPSRHAMEYWRNEAKAGRPMAGSIVHTTSLAGLVGNFGQANYASAKLAVVGLSRTLALEGEKYGVRSNAVSPSARTRIETSLKPPPDGVFDIFSADNVAPLICWLALADCPATGQVFQAYGNRIEVIAPTRDRDRHPHRWPLADRGHRPGAWPAAAEAAAARRLRRGAAAMNAPAAPSTAEAYPVGLSRDSEEFRTSSHRMAQFARSVDDRESEPPRGPARAAGVCARPGHAEHGRGAAAGDRRIRAAWRARFHLSCADRAGAAPVHALDAGAAFAATKPGTTFIMRSDTKRHDGKPVCTQYSTCLVQRRPRPISVWARDRRPARAPPAARRSPRNYPLAADQTLRYAEAARDYSPYTLDAAAAAKVGYPAPLVHGMCTLAFAARAIVEGHCGGDVPRLKRLGLPLRLSAL